MTIEQLFFELIQVALGTRICLSHTPSADECGELYAIAKKQSLVGICFAGVQRLKQQKQEPPKMLYLKWMGMAAKIQQRNEVVNDQCVELQQILKSRGFKTSILKGQAVASYYGDELSKLRQSGDIDMIVCGGKQAVINVMSQFNQPPNGWFYKDLPLNFFDDTEVEIHYLPAILQNPFLNKKWMKWCQQNQGLLYGRSASVALDKTIISPQPAFDCVFLLLHIYRHMFNGGIGLRQCMDLYFALMNYEGGLQEIKNPLKTFGLRKFTAGIMYILQVVMDIPDNKLIFTPDKNEGVILLDEIMRGGNFGKYDDRFSNRSTSRWSIFTTMLQRNLHLLKNYPSESIWIPYYYAWHFFKKRFSKL